MLAEGFKLEMELLGDHANKEDDLADKTYDPEV